MLFRKKRRPGKIKKSGNNYNKKCCIPTSTSPKDAKIGHKSSRKINSKRIN